MGLCPKPHPRTFLQKGSWESPKTFKKGVCKGEKDGYLLGALPQTPPKL
jgi:hypothetical protein